MTTLLILIIYLSFISLGLPDSLLGSAWPSMYQQMGASITGAGTLAMIISACTIVSSLMAHGKGIEVNTSSWHYGLPDTMPSGDILRLYKDLGGRIVTIGSDAHTTKYLADHVKNSQSILKKIGFKEICTFDHMTPIFHKL